MSDPTPALKQVRYLLAFALLLSVPAVYLQYDWWIYGLVPLISGVLMAYPKPSCGLWRFFTSLTIVGGALECAFLKWTFDSLRDIPIHNNHGVYGIFHEGHGVSLVAIATIGIIAVRLLHDEYELTLSKLVRTLLLITMLSGCAYVALDSVRRGIYGISDIY